MQISAGWRGTAAHGGKTPLKGALMTPEGHQNEHRQAISAGYQGKPVE